MCATCVAQGVTYVGGAVGALQVMRARARHRRIARQASDRVEAPVVPPAAQGPASRGARVPVTSSSGSPAAG